ncbi:site-specific integrase [Vibrio parahaemolyticus]|nr:site-specific integrase [Vibrio parahaemolyticus]
MDNGKTFFAIVDKNEFPGIERTLYISDKYPDSPPTTVETGLYDLIFFLTCMEICNISVEKEIARKNIPNLSDIKLFVEAASMSQKDAFEYLHVKNGYKNNIKKLNLSDRAISNALYKSKKRKLVRIKTKNDRIDAAISYIEFIYKFYIPYPGRKIDIDKKTIINELKDSRGRVNKATLRLGSIKGLELTELLSIAEKIAPFSPDNPFKSSKWRNSLLILLYIFSGLRRGAIAKLKYSDLDFTNYSDTIHVTRTPNDIEDPRQNVPSQKTREHLSVVPSQLIKELKNYYEYTRARFPESHKHTFIFVTEKNNRKTKAGSPLSLGSHNYIFQCMTKKFEFYLSPHRLRHSYATILEILAKKSGWTSSQVQKVHNEQHGWAINSEMHILYSRLQIIKEMHEANRQYSENIFKSRNNFMNNTNESL